MGAIELFTYMRENAGPSECYTKFEHEIILCSGKRITEKSQFNDIHISTDTALNEGNRKVIQKGVNMIKRVYSVHFYSTYCIKNTVYQNYYEIDY